jgi:acetolactate synthase regulatory subunit
MSEVISFRLDKSNPREKQALERLNLWISQGYSIRFILTQALLGAENIGMETIKQSEHELDFVVDQLNRLFEVLNKQNTSDGTKLESETDQIKLKEGFLAAVKQGIKPGVKIEG